MARSKVWTWQNQELLDQDFDDDIVIIDTPVVLDSNKHKTYESMFVDESTYDTHINDLPNEIITRIFTFLSPVEDDLPTLGLVCKKWRDILTTDSSIWKTLHVDPMSYNWMEFATLRAILRQYGQHVRTLTWRNNAPVYAPIFSMCCQLHNLQCLKLPIKWTRDVINKMAPLTQLQQVDIHGGFSLVDSDLKQVALQFPKLCKVSLNACWAVTTQGVQSFLEQLPCLNNLKLKVGDILCM